MNLQRFMEGIDILKDYYDDTSGYHLGAEHDQIYLYPTDRPIVEADLQRLTDLGWFQDEVPGDLPESYDPESSWSCYV